MVLDLELLASKFTNQTLVYWEKSGSDIYGKPQYKDPVELACNWQDVQKEIIKADGRTVLSHAYLLLSGPVVEGSLVFEGTLSDWQLLPTKTKTPTVNQGGREVIKSSTNGDPFSSSTFLHEAWL